MNSASIFEENTAPRVTVTFFENSAAKRKREEQCTIADLAGRIKAATAATKARLPWLKLARFGDRATDEGCLRNDANLVAISGLEGDYDGRVVALAAARELLEKNGILAIVYTSPSHRPDAPRWRVLCPFGKELPPSERRHMLGRLAGLFHTIGAELAAESWTSSQSYFFGSVNGNPDHQVETIDGTSIDLHDELDEIWRGKPATQAAGKGEFRSGPVDEAALLEQIVRGESYHTASMRLVGKWAQQGVPFLEAQTRLYAAFDAVFPPDRDARWQTRRADVPRILRDIYGKEASKKDAKATAEQHEAKPQASPPPEAGPDAPPPPGPDPDPDPAFDASGAGKDPAQESAGLDDEPADDTSIDILAKIDMLGPTLTLRKLVDIFNRKYAVANDGGKAVVIWAVRDHLLKRDRHESSTFADFFRFYQNRTFSVTVPPKDGKEKTIVKSYGEWWLHHEKRRQYLGGIIFDPSGKNVPGTLNLWRGWTVTPKSGDWSLMKDHINKVICGGRANVFDYVFKWLAHMVQKPHLLAEVAIVLRGPKGIGKGMLGRWLLRLCGQHGLHITNAVHLIGRFSGHRRDAIFVFADEAFYAADKQHEGILKSLITEPEILIETKYKTAIMARNMLHLLMVSNATWVVPASHDERRYLVLDVRPDKKGDLAYFKELDQQMEHGGLAAMLHDFLFVDLADFHSRANVPVTNELTEQKLRSLDSLHRWLLAVLARGFVWRSRYGHKGFLAWDEFVSTELLIQSYRQWCADNKVTHPEGREGFGRFMTKFYEPQRPRGLHPVYEAESVHPNDPHPVVEMDRPHGYCLGCLEAARAAFATTLGFSSENLPWNYQSGPGGPGNRQSEEA
jgi:hypothetical protein